MKDDVIVQSETKQEEDMVTEIAFLSASELVDAYRRKTLSPVEVTKTVLARLEPKINAFVLVARDSALAEAEASERRWAKGSPLALSTAARAQDQRARHHQRSLPHQRMSAVSKDGLRSRTASPGYGSARPAHRAQVSGSSSADGSTAPAPRARCTKIAGPEASYVHRASPSQLLWELGIASEFNRLLQNPSEEGNNREVSARASIGGD